MQKERGLDGASPLDRASYQSPRDIFEKIEILDRFYGSMTLKVFSNLDAYASRRFRTVGSPLICTCPAC